MKSLHFLSKVDRVWVDKGIQAITPRSVSFSNQTETFKLSTCLPKPPAWLYQLISNGSLLSFP